MSSEITEEKMIVLRSSDGDTFEVEEAVALESKTIKHVIEDHCFDRGIPLPNVTSKILSKVIEYCNRHAAADNASDSSNLSKMAAIEDLKKFDTDFLKDLDRETLFDLILAADYLSIKGLLDLTCQAMADMIQLMSPEQVREVLKIENDFTKEEEDEIRKENAWAFE